jgi:hypothetical protein
MNPKKTTTEEIRTVVFAKAKLSHERLTRQLADVGESLGKGEHLAAIGALEGLEVDVNRIRELMLLLRDCFES